MINDFEHLFKCLLTLCISSLERCLFKSFALFWIGLFGFCCCILEVLYLFWLLTPYYIHDLETFTPILWFAPHTHTFFLPHCAAGGILVFWPGIKTTVSPAPEVWTLNPVGCLLTLKLCPLTHKLFFYLMKSSLSIFSLCWLYCWFISKKSLPNPILWFFSSLGSSKSFILLAL